MISLWSYHHNDDPVTVVSGVAGLPDEHWGIQGFRVRHQPVASEAEGDDISQTNIGIFRGVSH